MLRPALAVDAGDPEQGTPGRSRTAEIVRITAWVVVPLACAVWVAVISDRYYPVYDEWVTISRGLSGSWLSNMFIGFNGHMWTVDNLAYSVQTNFLGFEHNWFVPMLLVVSLVLCQISVAGVLTRLAVPLPIALVAAVVVTYFGPGSETMVYQHLFGYNLAVAASFGAIFVALGKTPDRRRAVFVAGLSVLALLCDSANATGGLVMTVVIIVWLWPRPLWWIALVPPVLAHAGYLALDYSKILVNEPCANCEPVRFPASFGDSLSFGWAVLARAAGGLAAGGPGIGLVLLVAVSACAAVGLIRHRLPRDVIAVLAGGVAAALLTVGLLAYSRTGFWPTLTEAIATLDGVSNRYLQPPAVFLVAAFLPAVCWTLRTTGPAAVALVGVGTIALGLVFVLNLPAVDRTRDFYVGWSGSVKTQLAQAVTVVSERCGPGQRMDLSAQPVDLSPQISVAMIRELLDRGALSRRFGDPPLPEVRALICRPVD
ncbi:MAG: hypothetical protein ACKOA9_09535 [Actinomycetota bacterium]